VNALEILSFPEINFRSLQTLFFEFARNGLDWDYTHGNILMNLNAGLTVNVEVGNFHLLCSTFRHL